MRPTSLQFIKVCCFTLLFASCAPSSKDNLDQDVARQKDTKDPCSAASACTKAFDIANSDFKNNPTDEFCTELLNRTDTDLAICEVDIRKKKYSTLLRRCQVDLDRRLQIISTERNRGIPTLSQADAENTLSDIYLPTEIQLRDTSNGYQATTGDVKPKQVIFTFDDGPHPTNTVSVLRTLAKAKMKAHFFALGSRVKENPNVTKMIASGGHSVGNHSWDHPNMQSISFSTAAHQIKRTHSLLHSILGWVDPFFRFPFGRRTPQLGSLLAKNSMAEFFWAVDSNDWRMTNSDGSLRTNLQVINDTMNQLNQKGRGIVLLHDIYRRTAELLPELLRRVQRAGFQTVLLQPIDGTLRTNPPILNDGTIP